MPQNGTLRDENGPEMYRQVVCQMVGMAVPTGVPGRVLRELPEDLAFKKYMISSCQNK